MILAATVALPAVADDIMLLSVHGPRISIDIKEGRAVAKDKEKNIVYQVDRAISRHLIRGSDTRLISSESGSKEQLFIVLTREPSRPGAMGHGYCGAGYEDYLLLIEVLGRKLLLRDQFLVQSCLKSISMFIDQGDDSPANGITRERDGSFSYRLVDDDYDKKRILKIKEKRLRIDLAPSSNE
jgi:hypothetical protein